MVFVAALRASPLLETVGETSVWGDEGEGNAAGFSRWGEGSALFLLHKRPAEMAGRARRSLSFATGLGAGEEVICRLMRAAVRECQWETPEIISEVSSDEAPSGLISEARFEGSEWQTDDEGRDWGGRGRRELTRER